MSSFPIFLRVDAGTWSRVNAMSLSSRVLTVAGAFVLAAWNRFGAQGFLGPRAPLRLILTGIWGWLALALVVWLVARWLDERVGADPIHSLQRAAAATTVVHFPLIILGFYVATFGAFIRTPVPGTIFAILVFGAWIPWLLVKAMCHLADVSTGRAAVAVALPYFGWLAWIGRYLFFQVGHLL